MTRTATLWRWLLLILAAALPALTPAAETPRHKTTFGWVEWIELMPAGKPSKAKFDTGANTSSLHALNIEWFRKDGQDWVRFQFSPNTRLTTKRMRSGKTTDFITIEAPVVRTSHIKQHTSANAKRPVIRQKIRLDGHDYEAEFTLTNRKNFNYPVLFGRRFLQDFALVDTAHTFLRTQPPALNKPVNADRDAAEPAPTTPATSVPAASKQP